MSSAKDGITETVSYTEERAKDKTAGTPINMWTHWEKQSMSTHGSCCLRTRHQQESVRDLSLRGKRAYHTA